MAFNLKVYQVRHYPFQHPYYTHIEESDKELRSQCDENYTDHHDSNLDRKAMDEEVHRQMEPHKNILNKKKLNII